MNTYDRVMHYFHQIAHIPRPSKQEEKIRAWLIDRASQHQYEYRTDDIGNVIINVPATPGREQDEIIILQAHMDMVCVKDPESDHDFAIDPITIIEHDGRITADGTTLGADNGI